MKKLLGLALVVGVKASFNLHCYQFGGHVFQQQFGGPIGMRLTMSVSRIVMADWTLKGQEVFTQAGMKNTMIKRHTQALVAWIKLICLKVEPFFRRWQSFNFNRIILKHA